ncbi:hypothetical protein [Rubrivirga sp. IMCC43871]|uniref:hypothetical protein n=1 Tax=Rubrivirga sp. IMCC43871 TaxID=3391575 RepID=UPI0039902D27
MGQQQLLLLVLGIVIVGLAVVVGIQAFSENQQKANLDAMVNDGVRIASDLQAWSLKPQAFGGPTSDEGISDGLFADLGYDTAGNDTCTDGQYENLNGCFSLLTGVITAQGLSGTTLNDNGVQITVTGAAPDSIATVTAADGSITVGS